MATTKRPNVVVFFTDQQRWDSTGVHGNPLELTPNFDRVAREGTHLARSFTCQPVCGPARACLQTGLYPTTTGVFRNAIPLPQGTRTLAHHFGEAGYATGYIGKWHLAAEEPVTEPGRGGYDYWLAANALEMTSDAYDAVLYDGDNRRVKLPGYRVDALTDAAIRFIDGHQEEPFFLFLSFLEPHHQNHRDDYPAPTGYAERYTGRWTPPDLAALGGTAPQHLGGYWGMVKRLDEAFGRLLDALTSLGLREKTIVLFTSDHGCHFKTRNSEYKRSCHDASIRVPTALTGPGFDGGGHVGALPLVRGERADWPEEVFIQISESQVGRAIRTPRWAYSIVAPDSDSRQDAGAERYVEEYLYDVAADPYELTNLLGFASHQEVATILRERLIRRMVEAGEAAPTIDVAPARPSGQRRVSAAEARA